MSAGSLLTADPGVLPAPPGAGCAEQGDARHSSLPGGTSHTWASHLCKLGKPKKHQNSGGTVIWDRQGLPGTSRVALGGWGHHLGVQSPGLMGLLGVIGR